ncbi:carbonic anhydrase 15-like [Mustelus asterias]
MCLTLLTDNNQYNESRTLYFNNAGDWCYDIQDAKCGPSTWMNTYPTCGMSRQSPINIVTKNAKIDRRLIPIIFEGYDHPNTTDMWTVSNNGHVIQVLLKGGMRIKGGNLSNTFNAIQFHYHWGTESDPGSEHTIDEERYHMELHILHQNEKYSSLSEAVRHPDGLAVLGFLFVESPNENGKLRKLMDALHTLGQNSNQVLVTPFPLSEIIPDKRKLKKYYRYEGSLTNPGCYEAVTWTLFAEPILISRRQLTSFTQNFFFSDLKPMVSNFRPIQKLNGRTVYVSDSAVRLFNAAGLSVLIAVWTSILFN